MLVDQALREDTAGGQIIMVFLQRVQSSGQTGRKPCELRLLFVREVIEIEVVRTPSGFVWIDLFLDPVQACHQNGSAGVIRIAGGVRIAKFKPFYIR